MMAVDAKPKTLWQKLLEVQRSVTYLQKDGEQTQGGRFRYASSQMVLETIRAQMDAQGVLLQVATVEERLHLNAAYSSAQHLTEVVFEFTWINADAPEEREVCRWYGQGIDTGEKGVGKAMTYAEKYFLLKYFHVATGNDDPDAHVPVPEPEPAGPPPGVGEDGKPQNLAGLANAMAVDGTPKRFVKPATALCEYDWEQREDFTPEQLQAIRVEAHSMWQIEQQEAQEAAK